MVRALVSAGQLGHPSDVMHSTCSSSVRLPPPPPTRPQRCSRSPSHDCACCVAAGQGGRSNTTHDQLGLSKAAVTYARALRRGRVSVYPTRRDCCMPKLGAYPRGCTGAE
jgi:hypothetical protein